MQLIVRPRQAGKTTELIHLAARHGYTIVCVTAIEANRVWDMAKALDADIPRPLVWRGLVEGRHMPSGASGFLIDDLDRCLAYLTHVPVIAASVNGLAETVYTGTVPEDRATWAGGMLRRMDTLEDVPVPHPTAAELWTAALAEDGPEDPDAKVGGVITPPDGVQPWREDGSLR